MDREFYPADYELGMRFTANAAGTTQISGSGTYDTTGSECGTPPTGFADYPGLTLTGDLEGCLYTDVVTSTDLLETILGARH